MSPLHVSGAVPMGSAGEFDAWLDSHGRTERDDAIAVYKVESGKRTVTLQELRETALCHGRGQHQVKEPTNQAVQDGTPEPVRTAP